VRREPRSSRFSFAQGRQHAKAHDLLHNHDQSISSRHSTWLISKRVDAGPSLRILMISSTLSHDLTVVLFLPSHTSIRTRDRFGATLEKINALISELTGTRAAACGA
jgi:hypothetical protein